MIQWMHLSLIEVKEVVIPKTKTPNRKRDFGKFSAQGYSSFLWTGWRKDFALFSVHPLWTSLIQGKFCTQGEIFRINRFVHIMFLWQRSITLPKTSGACLFWTWGQNCMTQKTISRASKDPATWCVVCPMTENGQTHRTQQQAGILCSSCVQFPTLATTLLCLFLSAHFKEKKTPVIITTGAKGRILIVLYQWQPLAWSTGTTKSSAKDMSNRIGVAVCLSLDHKGTKGGTFSWLSSICMPCVPGHGSEDRPEKQDNSFALEIPTWGKLLVLQPRHLISGCIWS